jgi:hypothetical protein
MKQLYLVTVFSFAFSYPVTATLVIPAAIEEQLRSAVLEAEIEVVALENYPDARWGAKSRSTARILHTSRTREDGGWIPREGETVEIETPGGELEDWGVAFAGFPRLYNGRQYHAHLRRISDQVFAVAGFQAGLTPRFSTRGFSRNRTDGSNGSGSGPYLYWDKTSFPVPYFIHLPSFTGMQNFADAVDASFRPWRSPENTSIEFLSMGCTDATPNRNDGINTIAIISSEWPYDPAAIAITRNFYVSGTSARAGQILDTDILINEVDFTFSTTGAAGRHDVRNILTHEVGHFLGLGHEAGTIDPDATMYALAAPGETKKRDLAENDLQGLLAAYAGVGIKFPLLSSAASCSLGTHPFSCASVPKQKAEPKAVLWILGGLFFAVWLGRRLTSSSSGLS